MNSVIEAALGLATLMVTMWVLVFSGVGVAVARKRDRSILAGFAWGLMLGPIGWAVLLTSRGHDPEDHVTLPGEETGEVLDRERFSGLPDVI